jgi:Na+/H+ antiporter NhaD/arsenite permease-like protein
VPALLSLPLVWGLIVWLYHGRWTSPQSEREHPVAATLTAPPLDRAETLKAGVATFLVVLAFVVSDWPRDLIALGAAGILLINRQIASSDMLKHVDGNLLLLIMGLFVVNAAMAATGLPQSLLNDLRGAGINLNDPLSLFLVSGVLSNVVGNNPAVMLLVPFLEPGHDRALADALGAALALGTGFSSNLIVFGSLAGIIVVEQAAVCGIRISFGEFARAGVPVALACMAMAVVWILLIGM